MKKLIIVSLAALLAFPTFAEDDPWREDARPDFGGRVSAEIDKKLAKGLHGFANGEFRFNDNFGNFSRYQGTAGVSYKVNDYLKTAVSYTFIETKKTKDSTDIWKARHRFTFDLTGSYRIGDFKLSLRERFQVTHRTDDVNEYQDNKNACVLRSRFMAQYKGLSDWTPYAYVDVRNTLNAPKWSYKFDNGNFRSITDSTHIDSTNFQGNKDVYINRVRLGLGAEWELSKQHSFDFFVLYDFCFDRDIDVKKKSKIKKDGTVKYNKNDLESVLYRKSRNVSIGIGYKFSF